MTVASVVESLLILLLLLECINGNSDASLLFDCQDLSNQTGLPYTPRIPDQYFNPENVLPLKNESALVPTEGGVMYILPTYSAKDPLQSCTDSLVIALQYCYMASPASMGNSAKIFRLFSASSETDTRLRVDRVLEVESIPSPRLCAGMESSSLLTCCDTTFLRDEETFRITFAFGVVVPLQSKPDVQPLAFRALYSAAQYKLASETVSPGDEITISDSAIVNEGLLLFRLFTRRSSTLAVTARPTKSTKTGIAVAASMLAGVMVLLTGLLISTPFIIRRLLRYNSARRSSSSSREVNVTPEFPIVPARPDATTVDRNQSDQFDDDQQEDKPYYIDVSDIHIVQPTYETVTEHNHMRSLISLASTSTTNESPYMEII